jgi:hypothetical protein
MSQARKQLEEGNKQSNSLYPGFLLGLFFYPEDGSDLFLRNLG